MTRGEVGMRNVVGVVLLATACSSGSDGGKGDDTGIVDSTPGDDTVLGDTIDTVGLDTVEVDTGLPWTWPSSAEAYTFEAVSFVHQLQVPQPGACCKDFGDISRGEGVDNAVASLAQAAGGFFDINAELASVIQTNDYVPFLDHQGLPDDSGDYKLGYFLGRYAEGTTYDDVLAGNGSLEVLPESFVPGTGTPVVRFSRATRDGDRVTGFAERFPFPLIINGIILTVPISGLEFEGDLVETPGDGVGVDNGILTGVVALEDLFEEYNDLVAERCGCAGLDAPLFSQNAGGAWVGACVPNVDLAETCDTEIGSAERNCVALVGGTLNSGGLCSLLETFIPGVADIDLDGDDDDYEGMSFGIRARGVPATVSGIYEPPPDDTAP